MQLSIPATATALGFRSCSTLYRLLKQGHLKDWERTGPTGQRMLELEGLHDRVRRFVRVQINTPKAEPALAATTAAAPEVWLWHQESYHQWAKAAEVANAYLDCSAWGPPPWSAQQWATLAIVAEMSLEASPEKTSGHLTPKTPNTRGKQ